MYPGSHCDSGVPLIKVSDVKNGNISKKPDFSISDSVDQEYKRTKLSGDELLITLVGNPGDCVVVTKNMVGWNAARALAVVRLKDPELREWLKLILLSPASKHIIDSRLNTTVQRTLNLKDIKELPVPLPPIQIRNRICNVVKNLETKIELNRLTNQTLEQMAQAMFKSWFVDFDPIIDNALAAGNPIPDELQERAELRQRVIAERATNPKLKPLPDDIQQLFPSEFEECELGWIPKGWQLKTIDELNKINPESWTKKNAPDLVKYVDLANAKNGEVLAVENYLFNDAPSRARRILKKHDTIIGVVRPINRSFAYINLEGLTGSTGFAVVRANQDSYRAFTYFALTSDDCITEVARIADGAAYPAIKPDDVAKALCVYSSETILSKFEDLAGQYLRKKSANEQQLQPLKLIRDTLLPKLISGEVNI
jgi:type I restriction enzyme S subunit